MRLDTEHLTASQRFNLEDELWRIDNKIDAISSDDSPVELRGQILRS